MEKMLTLCLLAVFVSAGQAAKGGPNVFNELSKNDVFQHGFECVHQANKSGHCLTMGVLYPSATLVFKGDENKIAIPFIQRDGKFIFKLDKSENVFFISSITVYNKMEPVSVQGSVTLTKGGVGHSFVELYFQSQRGEGYHFSITIFAQGGQNQQGYVTPQPVVIHEPSYSIQEISEEIPQKVPVDYPQKVTVDYPHKVPVDYPEKVIVDYPQKVTQEVGEEREEVIVSPSY